MTITPHIALRYEELDLSYNFYNFCTFVLLGKSAETAATRAARFDSSVHQIVCQLALHPRLHRGAYSAPLPRPPSCKETEGEGRMEGEELTLTDDCIGVVAAT